MNPTTKQWAKRNAGYILLAVVVVIYSFEKSKTYNQADRITELESTNKTLEVERDSLRMERVYEGDFRNVNDSVAEYWKGRAYQNQLNYERKNRELISLRRAVFGQRELDSIAEHIIFE